MSTVTAEMPLFERPPLEAIPAEHLLDLTVELEDPQTFQTPMGNRMTLVTRGGAFEGPRLRGGLLPGGGDWILFGADGIARVDVRATLRTDDGALIHFESGGKGRVSPEGMERFGAGERIPFELSYVRTTPTFETGDERYAWLNELVVLGHNELAPGRVYYRLYAAL